MKEPIQTTAAPGAIGPYSQAIVSGDLLFCSGQTPIDPERGEVVNGDVATQTERVLENLGAVLGAAGLDYRDVVKTSCYLADMGDFKAFNEVYGRYFPEPYPARTTIEAARLPMDVAIEIEAIARVR